jgi:holo-[acyl-carrier protein] synthase
MKPPRAFPFPLNIGTDICHIRRIYDILRTPRAARFVGRILTEAERQHAASRLTLSSTGTDADVWKTAAFVAGR